VHAAVILLSTYDAGAANLSSLQISQNEAKGRKGGGRAKRMRWDVGLAV